MARRWFTATCEDCTPILVMPFRDKDERDEWVVIHELSTGHTVREEEHD